MVIPRELEAQILRLHDVEKWPVGTIAQQLCIHHSVVERVLGKSGLPTPELARPSKLDAYVPFIEATLAKYPRLQASRLWWMSRERGLVCSETHFRRLVAKLRSKPRAEAYLRLRTMPGEQAQVDWGHFGKLRIGRAERALLAFVIVLSYSRRLFLRFFLGQHTENFLRGHEAAFRHWGGCSRVVLYDNLKSVVLERYGNAIRFNPLLLAFAEHWRFEPRPVGVARGNEKGRVERAIDYLRRSFFAARSFSDLDDLNAQAKTWCDGPAMERPWPEDKTLTVAKAYEQERDQLLPIPDDVFITDERLETTVGKTPYVRFDGNDYSVPHELVRHDLTVFASEQRVRVLSGADVVAEHRRSFSKGEQIEDPAHIEALIDYKRQARQHRGFDRLYRAAPSTRELMSKLAERGENLGAATSSLLQMLGQYGATALEQAVSSVLVRDVPHHHAVQQVLEQERRRAGRRVRLAVELPVDPRVRDLTVRPHPLASYDALAMTDGTTDPEEANDARA
jgi:transposase